MSVCSLLLWVGLTCSAGERGEQVIDDFGHAATAEARQAWRGSEGAAALQMQSEGETTFLQATAPFADKPNLQRLAIDRDVKLNLAAPGGFLLRVAIDQPQAAAGLTLYFRSGEGWYAASGALTKPGWQTVRFSKASFRTEDTPAGWDQIDGIRIAAWQSQPRNVTLRFDRLAALTHDVALVIPDQKGGGESRAAREVAELVGRMLGDLGLGSDAIGEASLLQGALGKRRMAILAHNPDLSAEAARVLVEFVEQGGKLLVCYQLPPALGQVLGFGSPRYVRPAERKLAAIRLDAADLQGLPQTVRQASWNITTAAPAGHGARVIGVWLDEAGQPLDLPALLLSERGAFFSHIFLSDDYDAKKQMLAALLGQLVPDLWRQMAEASLAGMGQVGHLDQGQAVAAFVTASKIPAAQEALRQATAQAATARESVQAGHYADAVRQAREAHKLLVDAYLRSLPSRAPEGRAWWNHSGTGAYTGDWERTAKELAESGFNIILPNMLWGGVAHYASDVLPRSPTFAEHGDQIAKCVAACQKHGIEVHVWKVNYNLSNAPKSFVTTMREAGRTQVSASGAPLDWLCPSHPENQKLECESMVEVARKYAVDGLHFDYIRYPDGNACYCEGCRARFQADLGQPVNDWPRVAHTGPLKAQYRDWRCQQITRLVEAVSREARQVRPGIRISAAVFGSYPSCRESVGQDWPVWAREGLVDFLCPMDYTESDLQFTALVENQLRLVEGRVPLYPGIGATASNSGLTADRVAGQIFHARRLGAAGFTIFNLSESTARDLLSPLHQGPTSTPAKTR